MVYFIRTGKFVKIGYTANAESGKRRLEQIQSANPLPVNMVMLLDGSHERESDLHARFIHLHKQGEWFHYEDELREFIELHGESPDTRIINQTEKRESGRQLREQRKELGLTIQQVADAVGVTRAYISQVELRAKEPPEWLGKSIRAALHAFAQGRWMAATHILNS